MRPRFLADEDLNQKIISGLLRSEPTIDFQHAHDGGIKAKPDPEVLRLAGESDRILVSHDRETMPGHFFRFIRIPSSPGLLIIPQDLSIRIAIEELLMVWAASEADEWTDQVRFIPL